MVVIQTKFFRFYMDGNLKKNLDLVKEVVRTKDWDYVAIVAGMPGVGKSTFAQTLAKYCNKGFNEKYIAFNAEEFIMITNECPKFSSVILDESFENLNSKVSMSSDFVRIINHLQIIRQKNLFIFLLLPNFFDLSKSIALYRSHNLFVCYSKDFGDRGRFIAFSREAKQKLYILGKKFNDYNCVPSNFKGVFTGAKVLNWGKYVNMKAEHLKEQNIDVPAKARESRDRLIKYLRNDESWHIDKIVQASGLSQAQIFNILKK